MTVQRTPALRDQVQARLQALAVQSLHDASHPGRAAVAVAIVDEGHGAAVGGLPAHAEWSEAAALILTRRALHLRHHPGQWALPGGRVDEGETPEAAALRELQEEVGLVLHEGAVLGRLDDFSTRSGFVITPVVVWAGRAPLLVANPGEVDSIHRIPVSEFLRLDAPRLENVATSLHPVLRMPVGHTWIAAPTAAVLYQFREVCLRGLPTRVSHFEQPAFAWK